MSRSLWIAGIATGACIVSLFYVRRARLHAAQLLREIDEAKTLADTALRLRREERTGRISAERALSAQRQQALSATSTGHASPAAATSAAASTTPSQSLFACEPIGFLQSVFVGRFGCPRQGSVVPSSKARLTLRRSVVDGRAALAGLEQFSHVFLVFVFHNNTNTGKGSIKACVAPPRLGGQRTGLFSTRTPHRPAPIGLSLVRLDRVEGDTLCLSGIDLLDGTPILDVKPFIPVCDTVPDALYPAWIDTAPVAPMTAVHLSPQFPSLIQHLAARSPRFRQLYPHQDLFLQLCQELFSNDLRSQHRRSVNDPTERFTVRLRAIRVVFTVDADRIVHLVDVLPDSEDGDETIDRDSTDQEHV